eukprot:gnl/Dysnectes_brevis/1487_a1683_3994.p1 GENE.gnl/Dysnectes_brevis/1487_a1683_3994~~gnl/Dysnectes_brevis/1487_a1683_3994.p1  ORF type:complete len:254 (+),score=78.32 gnl/Dysnectes_brevis/1487_a1683_3994:68-829(+)
MSRKPFVGGNWKCNGTRASVDGLVAMLNAGSYPEGIDVVVAPSMLHLGYVADKVQAPVQVSAQNCYLQPSGAWTGEISAEMIKDFGLNWVILGHSERRRKMGESSEFVAQKTVKALSEGLSVMFCIGETLEEREAGNTMAVNIEQLEAAKAVVKDWSNVVVAYEPVWSIGTGVTATPAQAQEVHAELRKWMAENLGEEVAASIRILYGGSVKLKNAEILGSCPDVDGFLIGGASLKPEFVDICTVLKATKDAM